MIRYAILQIGDHKDCRMYRFSKCSEILNQAECVFPPPEDLYQNIYEGCQTRFNPDEIIVLFNLRPPADYSGRSVSISDIIRYTLPYGETIDLFCNGSGCIAVDFHPGK